MAYIIEELIKPKYFDAFIQENMKTSTYKSESKPELTIEYEPSKSYQAYVASFAAAMAGSVIDKNANKPIHEMPTAGQLFGAISRIGDSWKMDNDFLDHYFFLEGRYRSRMANYTEAQNIAEYAKLVKYLFDPYEKAVIAPWKRIDLAYYEGLFNGTLTVNLTNNPKSRVQYALDYNIEKFKTEVAAWGETNATPIQDLQQVADYAEQKGKVIRKVRMSRATYYKMCAAEQIQKAFTLMLQKTRVSPVAPAVPIDAMNEYLQRVQLPQITIESPKFVELADGTTTNMVPADRVVFQFADKVAVLKVADSVEQIDKLPNKNYSTYDDNLVGSWRDAEGRYVDYEMWATPVFTGKNDYVILKTDEVAE